MKSKVLGIPLFLLIISFVLLSSHLIFPKPNGSELTVHQLHLRNHVPPKINSEIGLFTLYYTPTDDGRYVNVLALDTGEPASPVWVVQNLFLPDCTHIANVQALAARFSLQLLGYQTGDEVQTIDLSITESTSIMEDMPESDTFTTFSVDTTSDDSDFDITTDTTDTKAEIIQTYSEFQNFAGKGNFTSVVYRGCKVPNIDLDNSTYASSGGYAGDRNACAPASAANSLRWLHDTGAISLPDPDLRNLITELSGLMLRMANQGVCIYDFIRGKLDFINAHELNVYVKFQSEAIPGDVLSTDGQTMGQNQNSNNHPTWDWLKQQMEEGEDVEMAYYWWDGEKWRGHIVVVTGVADNENGLRAVTFKHDIKQRSAGGTVQEKCYVFTDSDGRLRLHRPDPYGHRRPPYIAHAVAESPGSPIPSPVELGFFSALATGNNVQLSWRTESELNNFGFELLRNQQHIAFIEGHGTCSVPHVYSIHDENLTDGHYLYELYQIDYDGQRKEIAEREIRISDMPTKFMLGQNFPNPFNNSTSIRFTLPHALHISINVFDINGRQVAEVISGHFGAGSHTTQFDASDLSSGIYFYKIQTRDFQDVRKFILMK